MKRCMLTAGAVTMLLGACTMSADTDALPPLPTTGSLPTSPSANSDVPDGATPTSTSAVPSTTTPAATTTSSPTSTTTAPTTTTPTTTAPTTTAPTTTSAPAGGMVDGVRATVGGRTLSFDQACEQGSNVLLDGVTWAFAGNSFRFDGDDDVRSEAVLIGDGFEMPMLVASVSSGVYTYVGTPVENSVSSATVVVDHGALSSC